MPVPAAVALAPAALGFISNVGRAIIGGSSLKKDKAELSRLETPFYKIQKEYEENRNQAVELAQGGITQTAKDYYTDTAGAGLGTGIDALRQMGGSPNDIGRLMSSYNDSIRKVMAEDSEKQIGNIKYFQQVNKDLAGQKTMQWSINEYQPYQNKLKELTQRIAADKQNIWGGIQGAIGSAQAGVTSMQNNSLLNKLYGESTPDPIQMSSTIKNAISSPIQRSIPMQAQVPDDLAQRIGAITQNMPPEQQSELEDILNQIMQTKNPNG